MSVLLLFLVAILIGSIIVIAISSNKKKKEEEPPAEICSKYTYNNTCVDSCGDKYVDEKTRICYDAIPQGKFAFDKKIVSSCDDKYTDGQLCLFTCGEKYVDESKKICYDNIPSGKYADGKKIVEICDINKYVDGRECVSDCFNRDVNKVIEGKNCIKDCDKFLHFGVNNNNIIQECKDSCNSYYINDKLKISSHSKYCISPIMVPFIGMYNLFINFPGDKFIVDFEDFKDEKLFLQNTNNQDGTQNKELLPLLLRSSGNLKLKKFVVSPAGNTYGVVYEDHIDVYNQDIFNGNYAPFRVINPSDITSSAIITNPSMEGSIIEDCIIYDEENLLVLLKKINNNVNYYAFYHIRITSVIIKADIIGYIFAKQPSYKFKLYNAIKIDVNINETNYKIGFVNEEFDSIRPSVRKYTKIVDFENNTYSINFQDDLEQIVTMSRSNSVLDFKVSKDFGIISTQNQIIFKPFTGTSSNLDNAINSKSIAVTNTNKAYYSKYNSDKSISIWEASYEESKSNIPTFSEIYTIPDKTGTTSAKYETTPYVSLATNFKGNLLLCSITENVDNNIPTRKELHKINLTAIPKTSELLISS